MLKFINKLLYEFTNALILICTHKFVPQQSNKKHLPELNNFIHRKYPTFSPEHLYKILSNGFYLHVFVDGNTLLIFSCKNDY